MLQKLRNFTGSNLMFAGLLVVGLFATAGCDQLGAEANEESDVAVNMEERNEERPGLIERIFEPEMIEKEVPAGIELDIRLATSLSSDESSVGETVRGEVAENVIVDGRVVVPAGSIVVGQVTEARALRKVGGRSELAFRFDSLTLPDGQEEPVQLMFGRTGRSETAKDAATIAGSAIIGAIIGHQIDEDGDGRAAGAVAGAGVGTGIAVKTKGETIVLPAGTMLRLTSQTSLTVEIEKQ